MSGPRRTRFALVNDAGEYLACTGHTIVRMLNDNVLPFKLVGSRRTVIYDFSASQSPGIVLELKISKTGKAAIAEALDRMEAEIAVIRKGLNI